MKQNSIKTSKKTAAALWVTAAIIIIAAVIFTAALPVPAAVSAAGNEKKNDANSKPGAVLYFNLQNYTIITDTTHDWYGSRPTQKGLYQITAEYVPDEGVSFGFAKNGSHADPMIYLPVYDLCYNINIKDYPYIAVCYKSTATNKKGAFYFATSANQGLDESKVFGISMEPSSDWTITVARAGKNKNWTGRLTSLRYDISSGEFSGNYTVKWLGFFKTEAEAHEFGVNGQWSHNVITTEKTEYARGENIRFSVTGTGKGDMVVLVQKGDACFGPSVNDTDLYVSDCMPLYYVELENGRGEIDIDKTEGIYNRMLLPAGEYDLVYMPRGRYVEVTRTTITVTENIVREPATNEIIYVTRGPEPTETPVPTEEPPEETDDAPRTTEGRNRITPAPTEIPVDNSGGRAGLVIAIVSAVLCTAALAVFFIVRGKKRAGGKE
ncbi:MAG: hypothetical protein J5950_06525 [Clostridia bacterium]|nr:hypothetical protein [Clostridia bacterium]